jgi:hypothetical protein
MIERHRKVRPGAIHRSTGSDFLIISGRRHLMRSVRSQTSNLDYIRKLVGAGWDGVSSARRECDGHLFRSESRTAFWTPTVVGAGIGVLSTRLIANRKSATAAAVGGLIGTVLGLGVSTAFASQPFTGTAARNARRLINTARDAHWLETHPIAYG